MSRQNVYTQVASSMITNTEIITTRMAKTPIGRSKRVLAITAPVGPSSNAGELARQSLTLSSGTEQPVCGWVDFVGAVAELRDWASTKRAYEGRYRSQFDVTEAEYRDWSQKLLAALKELGVRGAVVGDEANYAPTDPGVGATQEAAAFEPEETSGPSLLPIIIGAAFAGLGIAVAVFLVMK